MADATGAMMTTAMANRAHKRYVPRLMPGSKRISVQCRAGESSPPDQDLRPRTGESRLILGGRSSKGCAVMETGDSSMAAAFLDLDDSGMLMKASMGLFAAHGVCDHDIFLGLVGCLRRQ